VKRGILALAIAASLAGCAANQGGLGSAGSTALTISKATGSADSLYVAAYQTAVSRVKDGKLSREDFLTWEAVAYDAVLLIRTATTIADLTAAQAQLATATAHLAPSN
jgi:hypothetical protein